MTSEAQQAAATPEISYAMASWNSRQYLVEAVESALGQEGVAVEVLIVDDGSTDGSDALAEDLARQDARVRFFRTPRNLGPAGARNIALQEMRGRWFGVLDSDDLIRPARSRRLLALAEEAGAQIVADDLILFSTTDPGTKFLGAYWPADGMLTLETYLADSILFKQRPNPGFLKPLIRADFLREHGISYDTDLKIGEDDKLIIDCLLKGARYAVHREPGYLYRRHGQSISHRLSASHALSMVEANERLRPQFADCSPAARAAFDRRDANYRDAAAYARAVEALKDRKFGSALGALARRPSSLPLLGMLVKGQVERLKSPR